MAFYCQTVRCWVWGYQKMSNIHFFPKELAHGLVRQTRWVKCGKWSLDKKGGGRKAWVKEWQLGLMWHLLTHVRLVSFHISVSQSWNYMPELSDIVTLLRRPEKALGSLPPTYLVKLSAAAWRDVGLRSSLCPASEKQRGCPAYDCTFLSWHTQRCLHLRNFCFQMIIESHRSCWQRDNATSRQISVYK